MQTAIADFIRDTPEGREADAILRACVHCGFCMATCPTYQLLGDELDGPRGRIYLVKQVLEARPVSMKTQAHLDRCLTCRSCETTCPSGVRYGRLLDIGRVLVEERVPRPWRARAKRRVLRALIPYPARFGALLRLGQLLRPVLPEPLRRRIPPRQQQGAWPRGTHPRSMLVLDGCVQPGAAPLINAAAARVLDTLGITLLRAPRAGCCGAVSHHLSAREEALGFARRNIDAWWSHVQRGAEAVVITASGCGAFVREYGELLRHDAAYAARAASISRMARDIGEVLAAEDLSGIGPALATVRKLAFHAPCTLQHGTSLDGVVEALLQRLGYTLSPVPDAHLCCGSAGTYSILQHELSQRLLENKLQALKSGGPDLIATANIGCLLHLQSKADVPVVHWIQLLDTQRPHPT
jgi:glycolate dehydrogenase iron-sulfur subunit